MIRTDLKKSIRSTFFTVIAVLSIAGLIDQMQAAEPKVGTEPEESKTVVSDEGQVLEKLRGKWRVVKIDEGGREDDDEKLKASRLTISFDDGKVVQSYVGKDDAQRRIESSLKISTTKRPFEMDWKGLVEYSPEHPDGQKLPILIQSIFEFDGEDVKIRFTASKDGKDAAGNPAKRPVNFEKPGAKALGEVLMTLERVNP